MISLPLPLWNLGSKMCLFQWAFFINAIIFFAFPRKFCIVNVFSSLWDLQSSQEKLKTMLMQNFQNFCGLKAYAMYLISARKQLITWLLPTKCSLTCGLYFLDVTAILNFWRGKDWNRESKNKNSRQVLGQTTTMMGRKEENTPFSCLSLTLYVYSRTIKLYFFHLLKSITVTRLFRGWKILEIQW